MSEIVNIREFLAAELTEPFIYSANPGNAGDALMACSTYDVFRDLDVEYINSDHAFLMNDENIQDRIVVMSGGGNLNEGGYNKYSQLLGRIHRKAKKVIVLPHTVNGNVELLSTLGSNVVLICREYSSYLHASATALGGARIHVAPDMAFLLNVGAALAYDPRYIVSIGCKLFYKIFDKKAADLYPSIQDYRSALIWQLRRYRRRYQHEATVSLFRTDIESTNLLIPEDNVDASLVFAFGVTSSLKARFTVLHLLNFISTLQTVHTNRLHIAIAAALLGKEVHLYANNYFKCQAVYEYSMRDRFSNVIWHD